MRSAVCAPSRRGPGRYPTRSSIEEAVAHVDKDGTGEINFDEFFTLMQYLRKTEGFTKKEIQQSAGGALSAMLFPGSRRSS